MNNFKRQKNGLYATNLNTVIYIITVIILQIFIDFGRE